MLISPLTILLLSINPLYCLGFRRLAIPLRCRGLARSRVHNLWGYHGGYLGIWGGDMRVIVSYSMRLKATAGCILECKVSGLGLMCVIGAQSFPR